MACLPVATAGGEAPPLRTDWGLPRSQERGVRTARAGTSPAPTYGLRLATLAGARRSHDGGRGQPPPLRTDWGLPRSQERCVRTAPSHRIARLLVERPGLLDDVRLVDLVGPVLRGHVLDRDGYGLFFRAQDAHDVLCDLLGELLLLLLGLAGPEL